MLFSPVVNMMVGSFQTQEVAPLDAPAVKDKICPKVSGCLFPFATSCAYLMKRAYIYFSLVNAVDPLS